MVSDRKQLRNCSVISETFLLQMKKEKQTETKKPNWMTFYKTVFPLQRHQSDEIHMPRWNNHFKLNETRVIQQLCAMCGPGLGSGTGRKHICLKDSLRESNKIGRRVVVG